MRIKIEGHLDPIVINTTDEVELENVYCGVGIKTDQGYFGIAERDGGIEVVLNGKLVWSSTYDISKIKEHEITDPEPSFCGITPAESK